MLIKTNPNVAITKTISLSTETSDTDHNIRGLLSAAEREVAERILRGQSTRQIADSLFRSIQTIQNHRKNIRQKLRVRGGKMSLVNFLRNHLND